MCSDRRRRTKAPSMFAISSTIFDWSRQGAELSNDCETFKGVAVDQQQPEESSRTLFFARCPPTLPNNELLQLFGEFGDITSFNLYRRWAKNSKGCGTVVYADKVSAAAALAALDGKQAWPESETPMVVEWAQAGKIRPAPADDAAAGTKQGSDGHPSKPLAITSSRATPTPGSSSSSGSLAHMTRQPPSKPLPLLKPKPHSNASSSHTISASQRLIQEAQTVQAAFLDCNNHAASPPLSEQDAQCSLLSHEAPMMMPDLAPAISSNAAGIQHTSTPAIFMRQRSNWGDSSSLLPQVSPTMGMLHGSCGSFNSQGMPSEQGCYSNSYTLASVSDSSHLWSNTPPIAVPSVHLHDGAMLLQQQQQQRASSAAAAAAAAVQPMSGMLPQDSASAAAAAAAAAAPPMYKSSCLWSRYERPATILHAAERALDNSACGGSFAGASSAAAAAAAGHCSGGLPQHCSSSSTLPSLLELIPALSWLKLQQADQQSALIAATAAAAAAGDPMGLGGSSFAGCAGSSTHAGGPALAAPAAAPLQEVNLDLNPQAARILVGSLTFVEDRTGADVIVNCSATGLQLRLRGSCSQIESACGILRLLLL